VTIRAALDRTFARTRAAVLPLENARYIVLSDQHKGQRDGADDFLACAPSYLAALQYYWDHDFTLIVLGDGEELWECRPQDALPAYENVFAVERRFNTAGRYARVFGNHDDLWMDRAAVRRYLEPRLGALRVVEALRLQVVSAGEPLGELFLVHGHQGRWASDQNRKAAAWFVRNVWRPIQRAFRIRRSTPARDECLRERVDIAMYQWTLGHPGVVLIAGHTHRPVWTSRTHVQQLEEALAHRQRSGADRAELADLERAIHERRAKEKYCEAEHRKRALNPRPAYFNTGCCCFKDGQITGIEIAGDRIRLIRWSALERTTLADGSLRSILRELG
jgi:UDP-2,3-diacylglucosamine pyrophosphatase LpxH